MDDNELSTLIHSLANVAQREREELARSYRSKIADYERYAEAVEQGLKAFQGLTIEKPGEQVLPMTEDEQRRIYAALDKAAKDLERIRVNLRHEVMHLRRPKYQMDDECPF